MYTVKIDKRGKILIPIEARKSMKLFLGQKIALTVCGDHIELKPLEYQCKWCGADIPEGNEYGVCEKCTRKTLEKFINHSKKRLAT